MTWLNLNVTLTEGGKRLEELLQQLKLRQQERERLDAEVAPIVREELQPPEGGDPLNKRRRIEPIGTRQGEIGGGGVALGWIRNLFLRGEQVASADGKVIVSEISNLRETAPFPPNPAIEWIANNPEFNPDGFPRPFGIIPSDSNVGTFVAWAPSTRIYLKRTIIETGEVVLLDDRRSEWEATLSRYKTLPTFYDSEGGRQRTPPAAFKTKELLLPLSSDEFIFCRFAWWRSITWTAARVFNYAVTGPDVQFSAETTLLNDGAVLEERESGYMFFTYTRTTPLVTYAETDEIDNERLSAYVIGKTNARKIQVPATVEDYLRKQIPKSTIKYVDSGIPVIQGLLVPEYEEAELPAPAPEPPEYVGGEVFLRLLTTQLRETRTGPVTLWQVASGNPAEFPLSPGYDVTSTYREDNNIDPSAQMPDSPWLINWREGRPDVPGPRLPSSWSKILDEPPMPDDGNPNSGWWPFAVWNWNRTAWCKQMLNRLGFSPSDLTL
jgi:hypothetical protein